MRTVLFLGLVTACGSTTSAQPDASTDASAMDGAVEADAVVPCGDGSTPPTQSFSLSAWPALTAATATDWTAMSGVTTTSVSGQPAGVVVSPDGGWVFAALANGELGCLKRTGAALTFDHGISVTTGETPFGLAESPDGTMLAMSLSDEIALFDVAQAEANTSGALLGYVTTMSVMKTSIDVTFSSDGAFAFVALEYDEEVAVVNITQKTYVGAIPIAGNAVTSVVLSPDGKTLYVTDEEAKEFAAANPSPAQDQIVGNVNVIDVATAETSPATAVVGRAFVGRAPVRARVSADGSTLWVTARGSNALLALDTQNLLSTTCNPLLSMTAVGPAPVGLAILDGGKVVAVADSNRFLEPTMDQTVMFVGVSSASVLGQVTVGAFPREIDADTSDLFVSNYDSESVSGMVLGQLPLP